jgi:acyl carrier protein
MRLRLLKTLSGPGKRFLNDTKQLKFILCPVVAKSPAEQRKFYELFDRFYKDVLSKDIQTVIPQKVPFWERMPKWLMWFLITLPVALLIGYGIFKIVTTVPVPDRGIQTRQFSAPVGDTITFNNIAPPEDTLVNNIHWSLLDNESGDVELEEHGSFHWQFEIPAPGANPNKTVQLIYEDKKTGLQDTFTTDFTIECIGGTPRIQDENIPKNGNPGSELTFEIFIPDQDRFNITWDFGDETVPINGASVKHTFDSTGNYQVKVTVTDENAEGYCESSRRFPVSIGQEKAFLFFKVLEKDTMEPIASFGWATWLLMSLLALAIIYYWVRWFARKAPEPEIDEKEKDPIPDNFKSSDKAPYLIPYRSQNDFIQVDPQLFRFADTMRSRQEGLRRSLDVPGSVKATIEGGGFPRLLEKRDTQPTEYLFLIDEQSMHSHQAKLFDYLINFLKEKDVLLETFYYNTDLNRFWNKYYPKGIRSVMLPRLYQHHRLVILGDAHGLLDPFGNKTGQLRQSSVELLKGWKERLLITPLPPTSWTWKEEALHSLFPVFPADVLGLGQAMDYIEKGQAEDEYQPDFETWKAGLLADRDESDVNRRRWHRLKEYKAFLKEHPDVYKWLCALSVCPQVNWETTIAIGQALKPVGIEVTFDKLLLLARIPFLQTGILSGRLRLEMMQELDEETEKLAREAIRRELEAVKAKVKDGHANFELNSQLAVQRFAVDPNNKDHKSDIRFLLNNGLLDKRQVVELEKALSKHTQPVQEQNIAQQSFFTKAAPLPPTLDEFLAEQDEPPPPPEKPFVTPDFIKAISATILFLLLFFTIWKLDGTDRLYQMAFGEEKTAMEVGDETQLKNLYSFVKEAFPIDSAKILNNSSVGIYNNLVTLQVTKEKQGGTAYVDDVLLSADRGFQRALAYDPDYQLAKDNRGKMWFSVAAVLYNHKLDEYSFAPEDFSRFHGYFDRALSEKVTRLDALHGKGLLHFYENNQDSAFAYYGQLLNETDSLFFDTLNPFPHLKYLLFKDSDATQTVPDPRPRPTPDLEMQFFVFDEATRQPTAGASLKIVELLPGGGERVVENISNESGNDFFFVPEMGKRYRITAERPGYIQDQKTFEITETLLRRRNSDLFNFYLGLYNIQPEFGPVVLYFDENQPRESGRGQPYSYFEGVIEAYMARQNEYIKQTNSGLDQQEQLVNAQRIKFFFEREVARGKYDTQEQLSVILAYLRDGRAVKVNLRAYDSPKNRLEERRLNSQRRVDFVLNMMIAFENGELGPYINSGLLEITSLDYGESEGISDRINEPGSSGFDLAAAIERRVELQLLVGNKILSELEVPLTPLQQEVRAIIVDKLGVEESEVVPSAKLAYDLGADELDIVEIMREIEKKYDFIISDNMVESFKQSMIFLVLWN